MKKLSLLCVIAMLSATGVNAFEVPSVPKITKLTIAIPSSKPSTGFDKTGTKQQVKAIEDSVDAINVSLDNSVTALASIFVNKEELIKLKAEKEAKLKKADPKEKEVIIKGDRESKEALLQENMDNAISNEKIKNLSAEQKALVADCIYNLSVASIYYTEIGMQAVNTVKIIQSNPTAAIYMGPEIKTLGKLTTSLPGQVKTIGSLSVKLTKIALVNGITVPKATKGSKPKSIEVQLN